ncbi:retrovirus-related pol polyprotein from transposon TNT 1-94 [Tanacetum coccineum]
MSPPWATMPHSSVLLFILCSNAATSDALLAQAFTCQCNVTQGTGWYVDFRCHGSLDLLRIMLLHSQLLISDTPMALAGKLLVSQEKLLLNYGMMFRNDLSHCDLWGPAPVSSGMTQLSRKIKVFQSDGGTEFVNHTVRKIFEDNGTLHRLSCPYTPQQKWAVLAELYYKHRHLVKLGWLCYSGYVPASYIG